MSEPFTKKDLETLLAQYNQLRDHFAGSLPPPPENLDTLFFDMRLSLGDTPRHFVRWLAEHPDELGNVLKISAAEHSARDSFDNAYWKFCDEHKTEYDAIHDDEVRSTKSHEDFDATAEGKKLGDTLFNANGAMQDA